MNYPHDEQLDVLGDGFIILFLLALAGGIGYVLYWIVKILIQWIF